MSGGLLAECAKIKLSAVKIWFSDILGDLKTCKLNNALNIKNAKLEKTTKAVSITLVNIHCFAISENKNKVQQRQIIITTVLGFRQNRFNPKESLTKT